MSKDVRKANDVETHLSLDQIGMLPVVCPSCRQRGLLMSGANPDEWLAPASFDFGTALRLTRAGKTVRRALWVGILEQVLTYRGHLCLWLMASGDHPFAGREVPWKPSQEDLLAEDWEVVT